MKMRAYKTESAKGKFYVYIFLLVRKISREVVFHSAFKYLQRNFNRAQFQWADSLWQEY